MAKRQMTEEELQEEEMQKISKRNEMMNLLEQKDYMGRKVAFEVAAKLKELHPDLDMPVYEAYKDLERQADEYREIINNL